MGGDDRLVIRMSSKDHIVALDNVLVSREHKCTKAHFNY